MGALLQQIKITEYKSSDKNQITALMKEFGDYFIPINPFNRVPHKPNAAEYFTNRMLRSVRKKQGKIFVAKDGEKVIGFTGIYIKKQPFEETFETIPMTLGYVSELFVQEKYRNQNIGEKLLKIAENYFRKLKCTHSELTVYAPNVKPHGFYLKHGYIDKNIEMIKTL